MTALYEDGFCKLTAEELEIKNFYCPTMKDRHVKNSEIKGIYYECEQFDLLNTKGWGMTFSPVWWALDLKRSFRTCDKQRNVAIDCGEKTLKGFTVDDHQAFLEKIKPLLKEEAVVLDKFPFKKEKKEKKDEKE